MIAITTNQAAPPTPSSAAMIRAWLAGVRSPAGPSRRQVRQAMTATASTTSAATTLIRSSIVGQAALVSSAVNGSEANARLLERGWTARETLQLTDPQPRYTGRNQATSISTALPR